MRIYKPDLPNYYWQYLFQFYNANTVHFASFDRNLCCARFHRQQCGHRAFPFVHQANGFAWRTITHKRYKHTATERLQCIPSDTVRGFLEA